VLLLCAYVASNPDYAKLEAWKSYIQFEESKNEPARVQMIYERSIQRYCLVPDLWIAYLAYLVPPPPTLTMISNSGRY
jgi:hypothetical protein